MTPVTCAKRWSSSFDLSVPDTQGFQARDSQDPCQVALITLEVTTEVHPGGHAHIGVPELVGDPGNGKVRLIEEGRDCAAKCVRNRPGQAARVQRSRTAPALLLWSHTRSGLRCAGAAKT